MLEWLEVKRLLSLISKIISTGLLNVVNRANCSDTLAFIHFFYGLLSRITRLGETRNSKVAHYEATVQNTESPLHVTSHTLRFQGRQYVDYEPPGLLLVIRSFDIRV